MKHSTAIRLDRRYATAEKLKVDNCHITGIRSNFEAGRVITVQYSPIDRRKEMSYLE